MVAAMMLTGGLLLAGPAAAQQITVRGGNPLITITTGPAGGQPNPVVNTTSSLRWRRQNHIAKITVSTACPAQHFSLAVLATNVSQGVAAPQVNLIDGMLARDLITNIPTGAPNFKTATLQYTASATFAQGNSAELGADVHTVTYTLLAQ